MTRRFHLNRVVQQRSAHFPPNQPNHAAACIEVKKVDLFAAWGDFENKLDAAVETGGVSLSKLSSQVMSNWVKL